MIEVVRPGALTTVQDLGRSGLARFGVAGGGAFDPWCARSANRLVGNRDDAALLEITLQGPVLRFAVGALVAVVGDDLELSADGGEFRRNESREVPAGAVIAVGRARSGVRCWLAIAGGIDVPEKLGSRATDLAGGFGGVDGRALAAGDRLRLFTSPDSSRTGRLRVSPGEGRRERVLRVLPGPDRSLLTGAGLQAVAGGSFRTGSQSDRRGVRLEGGRIALRSHAPLRSQPVLPGAVQLPPSGEPIVLGVDAPVTGGYPWVAQLVEADVGELAHLAPGDPLRFVIVDLAAAKAALEERARALAEPVRST
jgi:biotin-dependent carboxylase-like uncharacterized protein